ncbi:MAG: hypothetical protein H7Y13_07775 [Sphingobacteriaceae bacterium]|nr:hypothetical protein [Sphingobacteriaceae bacterium]
MTFISVKYIQTNDFTATLLYLRLYWGFLAFYFFFRIWKLKNAEFIFMFCAYLTLTEFIAIRIYPNLTNILPNYDGTFEDNFIASGFFGGVHSFGGNRTVTGVLMLSIYVYFDTNREIFSKRNRYIAGLASLLAFSTTAWLIFIVYLLSKHVRSLIFPIVLALMAGVIIYVSTFWSRLTWEYISAVYEFKADEIAKNMSHLYADRLSLFFGTSYVESESNEVKGYGMLVGDFSYLDFYLRNGVVGVIIFIMISLANINRYNLPILVVLIIGTFHYHVIFSFPGQIIFAYFLTIRTEDN